MIAPVAQLTKQEIIWLANHYCEHRHTFLNHYDCYVREHPEKERIGFLDIETEELAADYGIIFTYCIKDSQSSKIYCDTITKQDIKKWGREAKEDTRLIQHLVRDMGHFSRLVGHYASRFDLSFIRTRAVICGVNYPTYGAYTQSDTWNILRSKFKLSRNSLENSATKLIGKTRKNHLSLRVKHGCLRGERWALKEALEHNKRDVLDTEDLYKLISPFAKITNTSI